MAAKKNFVLRLNPDKYAALEKWAADEFRSINGQIEWIIDRALKDNGRWKKPTAGESGAKPHDENKIK